MSAAAFLAAMMLPALAEPAVVELIPANVPIAAAATPLPEIAAAMPYDSGAIAPSPVAQPGWTDPGLVPMQDDGSDVAMQPGDTGYALSGFTRDISATGWEVAAATAYVLAPRFVRRAESSTGFTIRSEGLFGRDTKSLGMDKLLHGFKAYVLTDVLQAAIANRTGDDRSAIITAGLLGAGLSTVAELLDGFSPTGFNPEDAAVNIAGVGFSVLRNAVPALHDVIDFRLSLRPVFDGTLSSTEGRLDRSRYLLAVQLSGLPALERSPLRFVELHLGYHASGFTSADRAAGEPLRRTVYVGIGFNVQALFARRPDRRIERVARDIFDYVQIPWAAVEL